MAYRKSESPGDWYYKSALDFNTMSTGSGLWKASSKYTNTQALFNIDPDIVLKRVASCLSSLVRSFVSSFVHSFVR